MAEKPHIDFGSRMKRARERRGIPLRQIATATKISVAALEALERNDISRLPGGIFSRAFVRSYATEIGLDPEETVREFIEQFPHDSVTAGSPHVPQEDHTAIESDRRSAETVVKLIAVSLPIVGVILYFTLWATPRPSAPLTFELLATAPVTLQADVDGVRGEARQLAVGERVVFEATREIELTMSDAGALQLTINGQPAIALGRAGESRAVQIGRSNYGSFLASQ
jgi:transcriptional regulator with XRE-family HTH domain